MANVFQRLALSATRLAGTSTAFYTAVALVLAWALTGPLFAWSNGWQLVINTATTIITFLMVFVIQHAQNRDTSAIHSKLDELIRATKHARNSILAVEQETDQRLKELRKEFADQRNGEHESKGPAAGAPRVPARSRASAGA
jgi:low affinity Fe/Cu permease